MPSTTSKPAFDGAANLPTAPKRRHRVDSSPPAEHHHHPVLSSAPDPKRARSDQHAPAAMSAKVQGKRPEVIDLTCSGGGGGGGITSTLPKRPSAFQPHMGARKLVIKNLRQPTSTHAAGVDEYYARIKEELDAALNSIFAGHPTAQPMEHLYRGVENICRKGEAADLSDRLRARCEAHLAGDEVLGRIKADGATADDLAVLRSVLAHWKAWTAQLLIIRWMYSYLDRSYLLVNKTLPGINDMGISQFRKAVFGNRKGPADSAPGLRVLAAICQLVDYDRREDQRFDSALLKDSVKMIRLFGVYGKAFEPMFLSASHDYFVGFAEERSVSYGLKDYINACERLLRREGERSDLYNFDSTTKRQLRGDAHCILIENYASKLLDSGSVAKLIEVGDFESMKALYGLLKLSNIQKRLKGPWEDYIRAAGTAIVSDVTRGDEMVIRLLELRRILDTMIRDSFYRDEDFTYGLREAFGHFVNDREILSVWKESTAKGTSKVGEMIAKYIDMLLRGGLKTLPKTLLADRQDRADAEKSGIASTGDEDAELDRQLDQGLELFRFIEGKATFEEFYKKDLARRLLMGRSASQDAERNMLSKLKSECGSSFTHNLEQMFKDQELAKDEMSSYKEWMAGTGRDKNHGIDLNVSILSAAAWPTYPDFQVLLPQDVVTQIDTFDGYYKSKHTGRKLTWKHNLAHCLIKAKFNRGTKELAVSAFQAVVLVLFNDVDGPGNTGVLSFDQIKQATNLDEGILARTLQSLACAKVRVLTKHPKGRDVDKTDTFTVNKGFTHQLYRVKINQIQLKETPEENKETHVRVAADRQFETQAAIVRIMKSRKSMTHAQLVSEVINQTKSRGAVDPADIKMNIEKLIEKDYIEREGGEYVYLA
ncbi:Cullin family-domain-containing protein [Podospora appendiculata]|uniref:Cullin family-domain-containing protein n=1 Tax=Podospora appendiculata TaxID=314037 RepID=A0AAE0XFT5_9PEZI|nr:Cullin family-domain-containing protein [Podospora appendiculata]